VCSISHVAVLRPSHVPLPLELDLMLLALPWLGTNITILAVLIALGVWLRRRRHAEIVAQFGAPAAGNYLLKLFVESRICASAAIDLAATRSRCVTSPLRHDVALARLHRRALADGRGRSGGDLVPRRRARISTAGWKGSTLAEFVEPRRAAAIEL